MTQQLILNLPVKPNFSKDSFIKGVCNQEAIAWIDRWPHWPLRMLAFYGPKGCGKTHLAHIWQVKSNALHLNSHNFKYLSPLDIVTKHTAVILDGMETPPEEWLFHFYNLAQEYETHVLTCSTLPPCQWPIDLMDLRSRLTTLATVELFPPDDSTLKAVLNKLLKEWGLQLDNRFLDYVLKRMERSVNTARVLVEQLGYYSLSQHRPPTLAVVRTILDQLEREKDV